MKHLSTNRIAAILEGRPVSHEDREHLAHCADCMTTLRDGLEDQQIWNEEAAEDADAPQISSTSSQTLGASQRTPWRVALGLALAASLALVFLQPWQSPESASFDADFSKELQSSINEKSLESLVLLGGNASGTGTTFRGAPIDNARKVELDRLREATAEKTNRDAHLAYLTALLATDQVATAAIVAEEASPRFQDSWEFLMSRAIVVFRSGRTEYAEFLLKEAMEIAPENNLITLNYALLLKETGRLAEARPLFESLSENAEHDLQERARQELREIATP